MKRLRFLVLASLLPVLATAQAPKIGDVAPSLQVKKWFASSSPTFVKGHTYVIEFWATWCSPCIDVFPHLNNLVKETKGQKISVISVTDEEESKVRKFLATHPLRSNIALDNGGATFKKYGVKIIPHTVIVGPNGKIVAVTNPKAVTPQALREISAGRDPKLPVASLETSDYEWDKKTGANADLSLSQVILRASTAQSGSSRLLPGQIMGDGLGLFELVLLAYNVSPRQLKSELTKDKRKFRVSVKAPSGNSESSRKMLQEVLQSTFGFTPQWVEVEKKVAVLKRASTDLKLKPTTVPADNSARSGELLAEYASMEWLAETIGDYVLGTITIDETGLTGFYDLKLTWTPDDRKDFLRALGELGLQVVVETRKVKELRIEGVVIG